MMDPKENFIKTRLFIIPDPQNEYLRQLLQNTFLKLKKVCESLFDVRTQFFQRKTPYFAYTDFSTCSFRI